MSGILYLGTQTSDVRSEEFPLGNWSPVWPMHNLFANGREANPIRLWLFGKSWRMEAPSKQYGLGWPLVSKRFWSLYSLWTDGIAP